MLREPNLDLRIDREKELSKSIKYLTSKKILSRIFIGRKIKNSSYKFLDEGYGKSIMYKVPIDFKNLSPETFLLKVYGWKNHNPIYEQFIRELAFYNYFDTLNEFMGDLPYRPVPNIFSLKNVDYIKRGAFLMDFYGEDTLKKRAGEILSISDIVRKDNGRRYLIDSSLQPLKIIHNSIDVNNYRKRMGKLVKVINPKEYGEGLAQNISALMNFIEPIEGDNLVKLKEACENIGEKITESNGLERVIHGELYPHNHLIEGIVDWATTSIGPLTIDLGYCYGSFPFELEDLVIANELYTNQCSFDNSTREKVERKTRLTAIYARLEELWQKTESLMEDYEEICKSPKISKTLKEYISKEYRSMSEFVSIPTSIGDTHLQEITENLLKNKSEFGISPELTKSLKVLNHYFEKIEEYSRNPDKASKNGILSPLFKIVHALNAPIPFPPLKITKKAKKEVSEEKGFALRKAEQ